MGSVTTHHTQENAPVSSPLIDVSGLTLAQVSQLDGSVIARALAKILDRPDDEDISTFSNRI